MRSIQSIIFIRLFAIVIIFFGVVSGVAYYLTNEAIRQFAINDGSTSLSFIINNVKANYESDLADLDQMADMKGFLPFDEAVARQVMKRFLEFPNIFSTVHMYKADGTLLFAERRVTMGPYRLRPNFHLKEPEFVALAEKVIQSKQPMASEVFFSSKGTLYQTYITPVFADEAKTQVFGILSGGVFPRLHRIDYLLRGLKLGQDNFILISDSNGRFITSDGITEKDAATIQSHTDRAAHQFFSAPVPNAGTGSTVPTAGTGSTSPNVGPGSTDPDAGTGSTRSISPTGTSTNVHTLIDDGVAVGESSFIVMSLPIDELKLVVTLGVNTHLLDEKGRELSYRLLAALGVGLLFSVFASIFVGDRLAKPFRQIAHAITEINKGNLSARAPYNAEDEIGHLSGTINTLAEKIQKSEYLGNLWSTEEEGAPAETQDEQEDQES
jgi:HAMP domain-containing protein